ncbi:MAG: hypothetical protein HON37_13535 [Candidatus Marinimicrobia bacterium]|jgi:hypothetical protein|nr:hypothetical protein [Candidatus Neomarinimicrobiota bacterium]MBT7884866.1 hypothetical protein [Candidatus Neomarinimicrobiota bacterium]
MNQNSYKFLINYRFFLSFSLLLIIPFFLFANTRDLLGDINNDGEINVLDIVRIVNIIMENDPLPTEDELWAADVNADTEINIQDIIIIVSVILGTIEECSENQIICEYNLTECCSTLTEHINEWAIMDTLAELDTDIYDVEYVSDDNIYAVGSFHFSESRTVYNVAKYDGTGWNFSNAVNTAGLYSIHYTSENDIWMTSKCNPRHWDGESWTFYDLEEVCVGREIFRVAPDNIYFAGYDANENGYVAHFDGNEFTDISPGISTGHSSVSGTPDGEYIFVTGWANGGDHSSYVLQYHDDIWDTLYTNFGYWPDSDTTGAVLSVTVFGDTAYFNRSGAFWKYNFISGESIIVPNEVSGHDLHGYQHIIVNAPNDIFMIDGGFSILHYNGEDWYTDVSINDYWGWDGIKSGNFDYHDNILFLGGTIDWSVGRGVVVKGSR